MKIWNILTKKVYKQKYFSVLTKNSNWEIFTKNLVTFKRKLGECLKKEEGGGGGLGQFADLKLDPHV